MDGNFSLQKKTKPGDDDDIALTEGRGFFRAYDQMMPAMLQYERRPKDPAKRSRTAEQDQSGTPSMAKRKRRNNTAKGKTVATAQDKAVQAKEKTSTSQISSGDDVSNGAALAHDTEVPEESSFSTRTQIDGVRVADAKTVGKSLSLKRTPKLDQLTLDGICSRNLFRYPRHGYQSQPHECPGRS